MIGPISTTLRRNGLHYEETFVSIAVYHEEEDPHDSRQPAYRAFGPPVILKPAILHEIAIACSRDFQNAVSNRLKIKEVFRDLRRRSPSEIEASLYDLLRRRPSETWSEARIYRLLLPDDVQEDRYRSSVGV
jgi:hypothetical protein